MKESWVKCEGPAGEVMKSAEFLSGSMTNGYDLEELDFNIHTVLKHALKKQGRMVQVGLIWRRVGTVGVMQ